MQNRRRAVVDRLIPQPFAGVGAVGDHPRAVFIEHGIVRRASRLQQNVVLARDAQPSAEDVLGRLPPWFAGLHIDRQQAVRFGMHLAAPRELLFNAGRKLVERVEHATRDRYCVVNEPMLRFDPPTDSTRLAVHDDECIAGGLVVIDETELAARVFLFGGEAEFCSEPGEPFASNQEVFRDTDVAPALRLAAISGIGEREDRKLLASCGIEHEAVATLDDVDSVLGGDEVRAACVRPRNVHLVVLRVGRRVFVSLVVIDAEGFVPLQRHSPQHTTGVNVAGTQRFHSLDDQPAGDDLFRRAVPVTGQHIHIGAAAEPEDAQRELHQLIIRLDGVADVAVLMRPDPRTGKRPRSCKQGMSVPRGPGPFIFRQAGRFRCFCEVRGVVTRDVQPGGASVGAEGFIDAANLVRFRGEPNGGRVIHDRQRREIGRRDERLDIAGNQCDSIAVKAVGVELPA